VYVQCILSFEAENPQLLSERIAEFQRNIYVDFDTRRVCGIMSRILSSFSGAGANSISLHKGFTKSFFESHFQI
jgi:hypothetical protein